MEVTCIKLRNQYQSCYVEINDISVKTNCFYIVETEHGVDLGQTLGCIKEIKNNEIEKKGKLVREASDEDINALSDIESIEENAFNVCKEKIKKRKLEMKLVSVKSLFDKTKVIFYFVAENRIDFRDLVKDLAAIFRTRIEMRQIGVRDETRICGGHGLCGRELCCVYLKDEFDPVSIKMAKEQNLNLNSLKISGMCGRLLCCLGYEYELYRELNESIPKADTRIHAGDKIFTVRSVDPLRGILKLVNKDTAIDVSKDDIIRQGNKYFITEKKLEELTKSIDEELDEENNEAYEIKI